jgi:ABC-type amino acid transport substrate-binding protein
MKYFHYLLGLILLLNTTTVHANSTLKVAIIIEPPFSSLKDGKLIGYNVEVAKFLAKSINLSPVFIQCPFARCISMIEQGKADVMLGLLRSPAREKKLMFIAPSLPLKYKPLRLFTLTDRNITINTFSDLERLIVGTIRGGIYFPQFDQNSSIKKVEFTTRTQLVNMLLKGRIDAFFEREESIRPLLSKQAYLDKISLSTYEYSEPQRYYIVISKNSHITSYAQKLSNALSILIASGKANEIEQQFLLTKE